MARFLLFSLFLFFAASPAVLCQTFLQKHVAFFDRNNDGVVYPNETYEGMIALGASKTLARVASIFINTGLSAKTRPGEPISLDFPIVIKNIALAEHGSSSETYDPNGGFVQAKFDEMFQKNGLTHPNALTMAEVYKMLKSFRQANDTGGSVAALSEWSIAYKLFKDKDGLLQKETLRGLYDGSLFYNTENARKNKTANA